MATPPPKIYNPLIPKLNDFFADSQPELQANFTKLATAFDQNHVDFNVATDFGKHKFAELYEQPNPLQTIFNEISLYSRKVEGTTDQIFMRLQNNTQEIQLTAYQTYPVGENNFFTFLPGNNLLYFGQLNVTSLGPTLFVLNPSTVDIYSVYIDYKGTSGFSFPFVQIVQEDNFYKNAIQIFNGNKAITPSNTIFY